MEKKYFVSTDKYKKFVHKEKKEAGPVYTLLTMAYRIVMILIVVGFYISLDIAEIIEQGDYIAILVLSGFGILILPIPMVIVWAIWAKFVRGKFLFSLRAKNECVTLSNGMLTNEYQYSTDSGSKHIERIAFKNITKLVFSEKHGILYIEGKYEWSQYSVDSSSGWKRLDYKEEQNTGLDRHQVVTVYSYMDNFEEIIGILEEKTGLIVEKVYEREIY